MTIFKKTWGDNADEIAFQYAGTGALKNDVTRTGKRTKKGMYDDGKNAITRYILNNFFDGKRQDRYDLFLGNYKPNLKKKSPFKFEYSKILIFLFLILISFLNILIFFSKTNDIYQFFIKFLLIFVSITITLKSVVYFGYQIVDKPKLYQIH